MMLTDEEITAIKADILNHVFTNSTEERLKHWSKMLLSQYPQHDIKFLLESSCGITATIVTHYITGQQLLKHPIIDEIDEFDKEYCYPIQFSGYYDHYVVVIPGDNEHQIMHSSLAQFELTSFMAKFKTVDELENILIAQGWLYINNQHLPKVVICRKIKMLTQE